MPSTSISIGSSMNVPASTYYSCLMRGGGFDAKEEEEERDLLQ